MVDKFIFWFRVAKTGGTSLKGVLIGSDNPAKVNDFVEETEFFVPAHLPPKKGKVRVVPKDQYNRIVGNPAYTKENSVSFMMCRNPFDRFVSAIYYCKKQGTIPKDMSISDVIRRPPTKVNLHAWGHIVCPQTYNLLNPDGTLYPDYLIRYEDLESNANQIFAKLGFEPKIPFPHLNQGFYSKHPFSKEESSILRDMFKQDFKLLNYD